MWSKVKDSRIVLQNHIPLPMSNSPIAKYMRLALSLAALGRALIASVFQPSYLSPESNDVSERLMALRDINIGHEEHARSVLLSIFPEVQQENGKIRAAAASTAAGVDIKSFIPKDKLGVFSSRLNDVCQSILKGWAPMQRARQEIIAHMEEEPDDDWWLSLPQPASPGSNSSQTGAGSRGNGNKAKDSPNRKDSAAQVAIDYDDIEFVAWPAFVADDFDLEKPVILKGGFVVTKSQVKRARDEVDTEERSRREEREKRRNGEGPSGGAPAGRRRGTTRSQKSFLPAGHGDTSPEG